MSSSSSTCSAEEAVGAGYPDLKIKLGFPTLSEDLAAVRAAKKVLRGRALMVDYNQSLSPAEAMLRCRALDDEGLAWIEEPILADDYAGFAMLAQAVDTPIQIGENFNGPEDMRRALALRAMDYVMPDAQFIRGVTGWLVAAALAQLHAMEMSSHTFIEVTRTCCAPRPRHTGWNTWTPSARCYANVSRWWTAPSRHPTGQVWAWSGIQKQWNATASVDSGSTLVGSMTLVTSRSLRELARSGFCESPHRAR